MHLTELSPLLALLMPPKGHAGSTAEPLPHLCTVPPTHSEGKIAGIREDVQHMVSAELARLQQAQQAQQEVQHAQQAAVLAESAAVVASAYALMTDVAAGMAPEAEAEAKQAHAPVAAAAAAYAADEGAAVDVGSDGALSFHFGDADGKAGSSHPSALELAKQRLAVRLPAEAAAGLEKQLRRVASGSAAPRRHADLAAHALQPNVVPAGGLYGAGSTTERHPLSAKLHSLRQEVSAEVRQVARLADDFQKTLSLYNVRASLRGNHAHSGSPSASSSSCSRTSSCGASHSAPAIAAAPSAVDPWKKSSLPGELLWGRCSWRCRQQQARQPPDPSVHLRSAWSTADLRLLLLRPCLLPLQVLPPSWRRTACTLSAAWHGPWAALQCLLALLAMPPTLLSGWQSHPLLRHHSCDEEALAIHQPAQQDRTVVSFIWFGPLHMTCMTPSCPDSHPDSHTPA